MVRPNANTIGIDDLPVQRFCGDVFDTATLREAMDGCDVVYHCVVDTRAWLRDPAPLFRTNVEGTRSVLEVARQANLKRFVFTSSYVTIGRRRGHVATEDDVLRWRRKLGPYALSRLQAERVGAAVREGSRVAGRGDVRVHHIRRSRLGPHAARAPWWPAWRSARCRS